MSTTVRRSPVRLARPYSPIPVSLLILLVWWVVAHSSGSGWVQVLGDAVFGMLLIGLFAPAIALTRARIGLAHAPGDAVSGRPLTMTLRTSSRVRITPIEPPGPECFVGRTGNGVDGEVTLLPERKGVHDEIVLDIATATPFGLQWWTRRIAVQLPEPLHVAPRLGHPIRLPECLDERTGAFGQVQPAESGDARGVREYRPGDRRTRVHWVASAHAGRLMVRETEEPSTQPVTLKVSLPADKEAADRAAERTLGTAVNLLERGVPLVLITEEHEGTVIAPVSDRRRAGRRLARAVAGGGKPAVELLP